MGGVKKFATRRYNGAEGAPIRHPELAKDLG
jgi:hypothetical protein